MRDKAIYEEVRGPLIRFAASLVGPDHAGDLVSEVMVATLQHRSLASLENPQAYLMRSVLNRARSDRRRVARERDVLSHYAVVSCGDDPEVDFVVGDVVVRTVAELPLQQRAAIYLVYWADLKPTEAAEMLGIRPATLRRYLYLARNKLRRLLDE